MGLSLLTHSHKLTRWKSVEKRVPSEYQAPYGVYKQEKKRKEIFSLGLVPKCMFQANRLLFLKHLISSFFHLTKILNLA